jgi:UDP-N-acetyl-D-glucosamine dehydrogenase
MVPVCRPPLTDSLQWEMMEGQTSKSKVVVVGQGYVGLPLAMRAVEVGYRVVGYDVDGRRVQRLLEADSYVEDIPSAELAGALRTGRYLPTTGPENLAGFDVALVTVPTPLYQGVPDLRYIEEAGKCLAEHLTVGAVVVLESTTYPGTTEELLAGLLREGSGLVAGEDFHLGYSPERIDPGNQVFGLVATPKVVSGVNASSLEAVQAFYQSIVDKTIPVSRPREAELAKLIENTFRHVLARADIARSQFPLRRTGKRRQRPHARIRRPAIVECAEPAQAGVER